jgi:hypothetical protein
MLAELGADNQALTRYFRSAHETCQKYNDVATASMIEVWIDQTERRTWFLSEIVQGLWRAIERIHLGLRSKAMMLSCASILNLPRSARP